MDRVRTRLTPTRSFGDLPGVRAVLAWADQHQPASPESVARAIFDGVVSGDEEIFPDSMSATVAESWRNGAAKALERQFASFVTAEAVAP